MDWAGIMSTLDTGIGTVAFIYLLTMDARLRRVARRLGVVEARTTPPPGGPGGMRVITDFKSGPVRAPTGGR